MCMRSNGEEVCKLAESVSALGKRVTTLESDVKDIKGNITAGFNGVNASIANLANQFGERLNLIEKKVVDEKAKHDERIDINRMKWHDTLRKVTLLVTYAILTSALIAVGINVASQFFPLAK